MRTSRGVAAAFATLILIAAGPASAQGDIGGMGMSAAAAPNVPAVTGFSEGVEVLFLHTEASDREIAALLTDMMGSPVLFVPSLAEVPQEARAPVYVVTNGVRPAGARGPLGFQPDVFPFPPGDEGYTPLRELVRVTWLNVMAARTLRSAAEVTAEAAIGTLALEPTGIVINMPMIEWPAGHR